MRSHKNKPQDWSKPFKLVFSKPDFEDIETSEQTVIAIASKEPTPHKKQQIITPLIQTVKRVTEVKPFAKITPNYIRLPSHLNVPKANDYELTQVDHTFLKAHTERFKLNGKIILTVQFMKTIIIHLEKKAGKDPVIPRSKNWLTNFMDREFKEVTKIPNYESLTDLLYNYWKNRREELRFPLYRPLWRPNQNQETYLLAFKLRQKEGVRSRRSTRTSQQEIVEDLAEDLYTAVKIADRTELREQIKEKQIDLQMQVFHNELKSVFPPPDFLHEFSIEAHGKDKETLKKYAGELEEIKKQREAKNQEYKEPHPSILDQKESLINFLATVASQAENCGLNYDKIFHHKSESIPASYSVNLHKEPSMAEAPSVEEEQQYLRITLQKTQNYLLRSFNEEYEESEDSCQIDKNSTMEEEQEVSEKQKKQRDYDDIFDFKKEKVKKFYFGDDDEGDYSNLRKSIASSFKKFQASKEPQ